jgi:aryl-alcohol dehydrogenase-like predicted oxidoreductase
MEQRQLGRTDLRVSVIGFGCGMVGGLMVGGGAVDQEAAVGTAIDHGVNYFDTAPAYGGGRSEENLGSALRALRQRPVVGTKFRVDPEAPTDAEKRRRIGETILGSVEASLRRLRLDCIDLLQLHNPVAAQNSRGGLPLEIIQGEVAPVLRGLIDQGKIRHAGLTGLGHAPSVIELVESGDFDTAQVSYSLLNPSAAAALPKDAVAEDYCNMLAPIGRANLGVIGIRLLSGGSLSGLAERHPTAMARVIPLGAGPGSGTDYAQDVETARRFEFLVREGLAESLAAAALRYGLSNPGLHTVVVGFSSGEQLDEAIRCASAGPLDTSTLTRIAGLQRELGLIAAS